MSGTNGEKVKEVETSVREVMKQWDSESRKRFLTNIFALFLDHLIKRRFPLTDFVKYEKEQEG